MLAFFAGGKGRKGRGAEGSRTFCLLEDAVNGAGAAAAGHCDVEFVVVLG